MELSKRGTQITEQNVSYAISLAFDEGEDQLLVIDRDLLQDETISGHPGFSTSTICMSRDGMLRYVEAVGHSPTIVDLPVEQ